MDAALSEEEEEDYGQDSEGEGLGAAARGGGTNELHSTQKTKKVPVFSIV